MVTRRSGILVFSLGLILILVLTMLLSSCSSSTTSTAPPQTTAAPATSATPATTEAAPKTSAPLTSAPAAPTTSTSAPPPSSAAAKTITLKFAPSTLNSSPVIGQTMMLNNQVKLINDRTNGRVKIDVFWSQTLAKATELTSAVNSGLADIAMIRPYGEPGKLPLSTVGEMPGVSTDLWALTNAYFDLVRQEPLASEMAKYKMKPICGFFTPDLQLISKSPIRTVADLKGKKVAAGGIAAELLKTLGAVPLAMSPAEQTEGLQKGTIDAIAAPPDAVYMFKFYEVGKYLSYFNLGPRVQTTVMNVDTWNSLPADIQKIFTDSAPDLINLAYTSVLTDSNEIIFKELANSKVEIINLNATDTAAIQQIQAAYGDKWATDQEAAGFAGKKVLADYRALAAKYEKISPYKK